MGLHLLRHPARTLRIVGVGLAALILPLGLVSPAAASGGPDLPPAGTTSQSQGNTNRAHTTDPAQPTTWTVLSGSESADQAIQSMAFLPKDIYVNAGDTVKWVANSAEPHTVTFLAANQELPMFDPSDPSQLFPVGDSAYDGVSYYNSGLLIKGTGSSFPPVTSYSLSFPSTGNFDYYCLVHGMMMKGTVHVNAAGTPYPFTQAQYDRQSTIQAAAILRDGYRLAATTARNADDHTVFQGADDGIAMVMRFIQPTVTVHVGESVTFVNNGMAAPHTVTFGEVPANPFAPAGDAGNFTGGQLSSGIQEPGQSFTVTFNTPGTFNYICILHAYMGMVGTVVVEP
jgi:plastocyanin